MEWSYLSIQSKETRFYLLTILVYTCTTSRISNGWTLGCSIYLASNRNLLAIRSSFWIPILSLLTRGPQYCAITQDGVHGLGKLQSLHYITLSKRVFCVVWPAWTWVPSWYIRHQPLVERLALEIWTKPFHGLAEGWCPSKRLRVSWVSPRKRKTSSIHLVGKRDR